MIGTAIFHMRVIYVINAFNLLPTSDYFCSLLTAFADYDILIYHSHILEIKVQPHLSMYT